MRARDFRKSPLSLSATDLSRTGSFAHSRPVTPVTFFDVDDPVAEIARSRQGSAAASVFSPIDTARSTATLHRSIGRKKTRTLRNQRSDRTLSATETERLNKERLEVLWNKPRRAPWGTTDEDLLENFKSATGGDFERFRALRRAGMATLDQGSPLQLGCLVKDVSLAALEDPPGHIAWQATLQVLRHEFEDAVVTCDEAIHCDVNNLRAWRERAHAKFELGDYKGCVADINEALCIRTNFSPDWELSGEARLKLDDFDGAIADCTEAIALDSRRPGAWRHRAHAKFNLEDYAGAALDCTEVLKWDPDDPDMHLLRARSRFRLKDYAGCVGDYDASIKHDGLQPDKWLERGEARFELGDLVGSSQDLQRALALDPRNVEAWRRKARIMLKLEEWRQAMRDASKVILLNPELAEAWVIRGRAKLGLNDLPGALPDFEEAARLDPTVAWPRYFMAKAKFQKGLFVEAALDCHTALRMDPEHEPTHKLLAKCQDSECILKQHVLPGFRLTPRRKGQEHLLALIDATGYPPSSPKAFAAASVARDLELRTTAAFPAV